jgi:hypothetical protein
MDEHKRSAAHHASEERRCSRCGATAEIEGDSGKWYCQDCFRMCGSCCLEFGGDDVWEEREARDKQKHVASRVATRHRRPVPPSRPRPWS